MSKCREILPPEPFDFKQPPEPPVVFLAGSIDMGSAEDWQAQIVESLADVTCVALNPRRKDWDKTWKQEIENPKFREQVEWELKGLEQCSLIALCLTAESKAPISLMELGIHVSEGKMVVCCPEGYWRKGNVDIVCARYGVKVIEDFEDFKLYVRSQMMVPVKVPVRKVAADRMAWRMMAREFIVGMREVRMATTVKEGDICTVDMGVIRRRSQEFDPSGNWANVVRKTVQQGRGRVKVQEVIWLPSVDLVKCVADHPMGGVMGPAEIPIEALRVVGHTAGSNHKDFPTKKEALAWLEDHALMSVGWKEGSKEKVAIYWNGKLNISDAGEKKRWSSEADQVADPMAGEKMTSLFLALHTWATRKATSLPPGAPVVTQILDGLNAVEESLKGKMGLLGSDAVATLAKAMKGHFTLDAPPWPSLMKRYGQSTIRALTRRYFGMTAIDWALNEAMRQRYAPNVPPASFLPIKTESQKREEERRRKELTYHVPRKGGMGDTHPFGSPLRRRRDYGERDGDANVQNPQSNIEEQMPSEGIMTSKTLPRSMKMKNVTASDSLRVQVIENRIVASAQDFLAGESWDGEVDGKNVRIQWRDKRDRDYRLTELPVPGKRRLRVRSGGFSQMASRHASYLLMVNIIGKIQFGGITYEQACEAIDREMKSLVDEANAESNDPKDYKTLIDGPWETTVFYLEVEPHSMKAFTVDGKDFKLEVDWGKFKAYSPNSDFQQADPHYTLYESKSPTAARKMFKILKANPDALKSVSWDEFGTWMGRNGVAYDTHFSQWH